jgi:hypothetical protein
VITDPETIIAMLDLDDATPRTLTLKERLWHAEMRICVLEQQQEELIQTVARLLEQVQPRA